jgi:predicted nucleotidyltransferase
MKKLKSNYSKLVDDKEFKIISCFTLVEHTSLILNVLIEAFGNKVISIYMYGSYGRGEGGWVEYSENGERLATPYNDYDIALVLNEKVPSEIIQELEGKLKSVIDISWIDITQYTIYSLNNLKCSIKNYDLKYASKWLYGDKCVMSNIPDFEGKDISSKDIEILFATRIFTLVGSFDAKGLVEMPPEKEMFFRNQMAKAILAIVDCILVQNGSYDTSYVRRVKNLPSFINDERLITLANWAINEKLFPSHQNMTTESLRSLYKEVRDLFFSYFLKGLNDSTIVNVEQVDDIMRYFFYSPLNLLKRCVLLVLDKLNKRDTGVVLVVIQAYIAFDYLGENNEFDEKIMMLSQKYLGISDGSNVETLRKEIVRLRLNNEH